MKTSLRFIQPVIMCLLLASKATAAAGQPPANDPFANRTLLVGSAVVLTNVTNLNATKEPGEPNHAGNGGGKSVWFMWTAPASGQTMIDLTGSTFDTLLAVYDGKALDRLSGVASNDDSGTNRTSKLLFAVEPGNDYQIAVDGKDGAAGNIHLSLTFASSPLILTHPATQTAYPGDNVTLSVEAIGALPLSYQWRFNGVDVAGAANPTLTLTAVTTSQAGSYVVVVSNPVGTVTSREAVLVVAKGSVRGLIEPAEAIAAGAQWAVFLPIWRDSGQTASAVPVGDQFVNFKSVPGWVTPASQRITVRDGATNEVTGRYTRETGVLQVILMPAGARGAGAQWRRVGSDLWFNSGETESGVAVGDCQVEFKAVLGWLTPPVQTVTVAKAPSTPYIVTYGWVAGTLVVTLKPSEAVTAGARWQFQGMGLWRESGVPVEGVPTNRYTIEFAPVAGWATPAAQTVTVLQNQTATLEAVYVRQVGSVRVALEPAEAIAAGAQWAVFLPIWRDGGQTVGAVPAGDQFVNFKSVPDWVTPASQRITVRDGATNEVTGRYTLETGGLQVTIEPAEARSAGAQWRRVGSTVWFDSAAIENGVTVGSYQVEFKTVSKWLTPPNQSVSVGARQTVSRSAEYLQPPTIISQPQNLEVYAGEDASFGVSASGFPAPSYQWRLNGVDVAGATNATLTLTGVRTNQAGNYVVVVSNMLGTVASVPVELTVLMLPLEEALDTPDLVWTTGGSGWWYGQGRQSHDGVDAARSGRVEDTEQSWLEATVAGPGTLSFWWKVSSGPSQDHLRFGVGGVELAEISGQVDWRRESYELGAGNQVLRWSYWKDSIGSASQDAAWVDQVVFMPSPYPPTITRQPVSQAAHAGQTVSFEVGVSGFPTPTFQWQFNGTNLPGQTNAALMLTSVTTNQAGHYSVVVSNSVGTMTSRRAILTFGNLLSGQVTDATNGRPIPGATVRVGTITATTDEGGRYELTGVPPGSLLVDFDANKTSVRINEPVQFINNSKVSGILLAATAVGYEDYENSQIELPGDGGVVLSFSMSPLLTDGMRFVLNWGANPVDLDAHLLTPQIEGTCYNVFYPPNAQGSVTAAPYAKLDYDVQTGFGPETITIHQFFPGLYHYYVKNFEGTSEIAGSGASVQVYTEAGRIRTVYAPPSGVGRFWHVCDVDGATRKVTVVNQLLSAPPQSSCAQAGLHDLRLEAATDVLAAANTSTTLTYLWSFGDGLSSNLEQPVHAYSATGCYTVSLTVTGTNGLPATATKVCFVKVTSTNSTPTISAIADQVLYEDTPSAAIPFTVGPQETPAANLEVTASCSDTNLVPLANIVLRGNGTDWTVQITPATNQFGTNLITLTVKDGGGLTASTSFALTVNPVNDPPTLDPIADLTIPGGAPPQTVLLTGISAGPPNELQPLRVTAASSNPGLILDPVVTYASPNATGSLTLTLLCNTNDTAVITVLVTDGQSANAKTTRSFKVTVVATNRPPSITPIADQMLNENTPSAAIPFTVGDQETPAANLEVTASCSDTNLVPLANIVLRGNGTNWTVQITPATNQFGTNLVTLTVKDGGGLTASTSFALTVKAVNDPPTVQLIAPAEGAEFPVGTNLTLIAQAQDADGSISNVVFLSETGRLGIVLTNPYRLTWTNVPAGLHTLLAIATDNAGSASTSAPVHVSMLSNAVPLIWLTSPAERSIFTNNADIPLQAELSDPQGLVRRVVFVSGSTTIGQAISPPHTSLWQAVALGDYYVHAEAYGVNGLLAESSTNRVFVSDACGSAAIVGNPGDPEIDQLVEYLFQLGVRATVFAPSDLNATKLAPFNLIIVAGLGSTTLSDSLVTLFQELFRNGNSLYIVDDTPVPVAGPLSPAARQSWQELVHLRPDDSATGDANITLERQAVIPGIVEGGKIGSVADFTYSGVAQRTVVSGGAVVLGKSGRSDVLVAYDDQTAGGRARMVCQAFRVGSGADETSLVERKRLFQNAVWWLLKCYACTDASTGLPGLSASDPAEVGELLTYTLVVGCAGECDAMNVVGTVRLATNLTFVTVLSETGYWTERDDVVTINLGRMARATRQTIQVIVRPTAAGSATTCCTVRASNEGSDHNECLTTEVLPSHRPLLGISATVERGVAVTATGPTTGTCVLEASVNGRDWSEVWRGPLQGGAHTWSDPQWRKFTSRFFRAKWSP